jgi:hypothetical protein
MSGVPLRPGVQAALDELPGITTRTGLMKLINSLSASVTSPNVVLYLQLARRLSLHLGARQ